MLIALDGSDRAFETIKYVTRIPPFRRMDVTLFTVVSKIPEQYWDLERQPDVGRRIREIHAWEIHNNRTLQEYMQEAKRRLADAGFRDSAISVNMQERRKGIARDIIAEVKRGYDAVALGRKGASATKGILLGGVAVKLLEKLSFVPLLVVGRFSMPERILIAVDGSETSMRIVDYVGNMLRGCDCLVTLAHVVRSAESEFLKAAEQRIKPVFTMAKSHLTNCGFLSGQIDSKILTGMPSRARAIVNEAERLDCGTIVVGRRGVTQTRDFFIGRVSNKVVQLAKGKVVWVVN
jgi:nucleotide-binding universal stress UspA family protein